MTSTNSIKQRKADITGTVVEEMGDQLAGFYDQMLMNSIKQKTIMDEIFLGKITGYRKVKVPKYLKIKVPFVEKDYDNDYEFGTGEFRGWLFGFREVNGPRIGTKTIRVPVMKKPKNRTIKFTRYSDLSPKKETIKD